MQATTPPTEWVADFETLGQTDFYGDGTPGHPPLGYVAVYLWHARSVWTDEERIGYDIDSFLDFLSEGNVKKIGFFNLRFDGSFILWRILDLGWEYSEKAVKGVNTYSSIITDQGAWMQLTLRFNTGRNHHSKKNRCTVKIWDVAKKYPGFSLEKVAKTLGIEGKSGLDVYSYRGANWKATPEEIERCRGDTRITRDAVRDLRARGMDALTMAGDALAVYKSMTPMFDKWFPELSLEVFERVQKSYKGGWTYVNPSWQNEDIITKEVKVYDVNSMYPWALRTQPMPYGQPWYSSEPPDADECVYIIECSCNFSLKANHFPSIQIKGNGMYGETEYLERSEGITHLTLAQPDWELFLENYDVTSLAVDGYICFRARTGMFDEYIDRFMAEKEDAVRRIAEGDPTAPMDKDTSKRFLNSLYGRYGMNKILKGKRGRLEDSVITWDEVEEEGSGGYNPVASFTTAYARRKVIESANAYGDDFVYCDTDSVHVVSDEHLLEEHPSRLGAFKLEGRFSPSRYIRAKTYLHRDTESGEWEVKCAGMPDRAKDNVTWDNFHENAEFEGKLSGRQVPGGYCLIDVPYKIKVGRSIYNG